MLTPAGRHIIGGMFGLETMADHRDSHPPFLSDNVVFLANARSGIRLLIEQLAPDCVWMPSFYCDHVLKIVEEYATAVRYYEVDYDLAIPSLAWVEAVQSNDLVVITDYFGFPCSVECKKRVKERGAWLLEDACQALLTEKSGNDSDFVLFSPRKFLGVPDGGILTTKHGSVPVNISMSAPPAEWWLKAFSASALRREFDTYGGDRRWFNLFQESEITAPIGAYAMSELTRMLLQHGFNYPLIAEQRVENYKLLASTLCEIALFPTLPEGVVPLGFPIRVADRDRIRHRLFEYDIFPPVHWPIKGVVPEKFIGSHRLSAEIMTLPCDQRYAGDDMHRIAAAVLKEMPS